MADIPVVDPDGDWNEHRSARRKALRIRSEIVRLANIAEHAISNDKNWIKHGQGRRFPVRPSGHEHL
jgi:hypothetical protein